MKDKLTFAIALGLLLAVGGVLAVEKTMTVTRCQTILKNGKQCPYQAESGATHCWRHRGAVKATRETLDDAGEGLKKGWQNTKTWTTNAWEKTKGGVREALDATEDALKDARDGWRDLTGGKEKKEKAK